jgi:cysteinyl-tRNA synthetase
MAGWRAPRPKKGEGRIEAVEGKRHAADFAIWRKTPPGEKRQMEWDSPWGRGAPGWHLECSVMSGELLGLPFDIHTGGIDHREIHHPNEIAQNQAITAAPTGWIAPNIRARGCGCTTTSWSSDHGQDERSRRASSCGCRLLIDKGFHPLAYRMMCLQAHYRSELEFSWDNLAAALTRLKKMLLGISRNSGNRAVLKDLMDRFDNAISNDLGTPAALPIFEEAIWSDSLSTVKYMDQVMGLDLANLNRADLRIRPKSATLTEAEIEARWTSAPKPAPPRTSPRPTPSATTSSPRASR